MDFPDEKGVTNRKHLDQIWSQTGSKPDTYKDVDIPPAGEDLWIAFWELRNSVEEKIGWTDIYHYCLLNQVYFASWEINLMQVLNVEANKFVHKKHRDAIERDKRKTKKTAPKYKKPR